jgi:hypothetical protein
MLQISAAPLPVLNKGEDLEENEDVAINIVDEHSSWTVVKKKKKNKKYSDTVKWTKQQKKNFEQFGDPWNQEPYKYYHAAAHDTPVAVPPQLQQQQQQQPVLQQQPVVQPQPLLPPPQQPIVLPPQLPVGQLIQPAPVQPQPVAPVAVPQVVITPPPETRTPKIQKRRLPTIPEEDEATATRRPKVENPNSPAATRSPGGSPSQAHIRLGRQRHRDTAGDDDERLREVFEQLNLAPEFELLEASPTSSDDEPASHVFKTEPLSPITPKFAPPSPLGATGGPPSQRMRQMEKDFANTQYKRLLEAEALEKKKRKELAKEKEVKIKQEKDQAKAVYQQLLEAEKKAKEKKEIKKEK